MCELNVQTMDDKQTKEYIQEFVGLNRDVSGFDFHMFLIGLGSNVRVCFQEGLQKRDWEQTFHHTQSLWELCKHPDNISRFDTQSAALGIRDHLNLQFVKEVQELHRDHHKNPPLEILKYCKALELKHGHHMFNPFLRLKGIHLFFWNFLSLICTS